MTSPWRNDFAIPVDGPTYLNTAAEGLPRQRAIEASQRYAEAKMRGSLGRPEFDRIEEAAAAAGARLTGFDHADMALTPSVSDAISTLAFSYPWEPGDEVVLTDLEFPANVLPWLAVRDRFGVNVRVVPTAGGLIDPDRVAEASGPRTRVISVSAVSYKSGGIADVAELARVAGGVDALLCVDATQALGIVPLDLTGADVAWCSGYKWLGGLHGAALSAVRERARNRLGPGPFGWRSVPNIFTADRFATVHPHDDGRRFRLGSPPYPALYALHAALEEVVDLDAEAASAHVRTLGDALVDGLADLGVELLTPAEPARRAGIVAFEHLDFAAIGEALADANVVVWAKDRRVRISFHLYNTPADIETCLHELSATLPAHAGAKG